MCLWMEISPAAWPLLWSGYPGVLFGRPLAENLNRLVLHQAINERQPPSELIRHTALPGFLVGESDIVLPSAINSRHERP